MCDFLLGLLGSFVRLTCL